MFRKHFFNFIIIIIAFEFVGISIHLVHISLRYAIVFIFVFGQQLPFRINYQLRLSHQTFLPVVGLRDCEDFGRVSLKDYNDIELLDESGCEKLVSVSGAKACKSTVNSCADGIAVGYYSYATEEKMELFVPVNRKYTLNMKGYSIKPYHTASFDASYQSVSANSDHRIRNEKDHFSDWYFMNTDSLQRSINMNW